MAFMSRWAVVIMSCPNIAFASLVIVYFSNYQFLTIYFLLCPCPCRKIGYYQKLIGIYDIHLIQWYSIAIVRLRHILHLWIVSTCLQCYFSLFSMFLCLKMNKFDSLTLLACYRFTRFQRCFNLCSAHHAICVLIYFSLADTAVSYFLIRRSSLVWE